MRRLCAESSCPYPGRSAQQATVTIPSLAAGLTGRALWPHHPERANAMKHGSAFRGNSVCVWAEVSRGHSSCLAGAANEGLNIGSREEPCTLNSERADRLLPDIGDRT